MVKWNSPAALLVEIPQSVLINRIPSSHIRVSVCRCPEQGNMAAEKLANKAMKRSPCPDTCLNQLRLCQAPHMLVIHMNDDTVSALRKPNRCLSKNFRERLSSLQVCKGLEVKTLLAKAAFSSFLILKLYSSDGTTMGSKIIFPG